MKRYCLGDRFSAKGTRDGDVFEIVEAKDEPYDDTTYVLQGIRFGVKYTISDSAIDNFYYKVKPTNKK